MNIPIQETVEEIEKVDKEEDKTRAPELTLESLKAEKKPAEPTVDEEEEDRRAYNTFFTSACLTSRHSRH